MSPSSSLFQVLARPAYSSGTPRINSIQRTRHRRAVPFLFPKSSSSTASRSACSSGTQLAKRDFGAWSVASYLSSYASHLVPQAPMYYRGLLRPLVFHTILTAPQVPMPLSSCTTSPTPQHLTTYVAGLKVHWPNSLPIRSPTYRHLSELKKNCPPELIIYIVGSKADLYRHRQVTPDFARLCLHNWFPPLRTPPPLPAPTPMPQLSTTLSYIRPRFTSFPSLRSPPTSPPAQVIEAPAYLDLHPNSSTRSRQSTSRPRTPAGLSRANTTASGSRTPQTSSSRFGSHFGGAVGGWNNELGDNSSNSINEDDEDAGDDADTEWGLSKGMELFEVSAKDDFGACSSPTTSY